MKFLKVTAIVFVLLFGLSLFMLSNQIGGWRAFTVMSGSMEPTIQTGALVVTQRVFPSTLKENDIITFIRPDKTSEFVTHRITSVTQKEQLTTLKTKGDANNKEDQWVLAGGGVIGKVQFSIPYVGYLLSFSQTKYGLLLFILLPAVLIIIDEMHNIIKLFKKEKTKPVHTTEITVLFVTSLLSAMIINAEPTQALLSDQALLENNKFSVVIPTLTPTPSSKPCGGNTSIVVSGNGAGSNNTVNVTNNCTTVINQNNNTSVTNTINSTSNSGNNSSSYNTSSSSITTSNSVSSISTSTVLGTNTVSTGNTTVTTNQVTETQTIITPTPTIVQETAPEASGSGSVE